MYKAYCGNNPCMVGNACPPGIKKFDTNNSSKLHLFYFNVN